MTTKQLSVFIENRKGRLSEVLDVLKEGNVNIISMSLADTTEYGLLRLIVNNPALGKEKLSEKGFSCLLSDVMILQIPHVSGSLQQLLKVVEKADINVEYMYGLSIDKEEAYVVLKASNFAKTEEVLTAIGVTTISPEKLLQL